MIKLFRSFFTSFILLLLLSLLFFDGVKTGQAQSNTDWSEPINISHSGSVLTPTLVIDSNGVHHSIWVDTIDNGYKYSYSSDGVVWSTPVAVKFPFTAENPAPKIFPGPNGVIHIFWQEDNKSLHHSSVSPNIFGSPGSWKTDELADSVTDYNVHVDDQGTVDITYIRDLSSATNPPGVYYRYSLSNGSSWSQARLLYGSEYLRSALAGDAHISISSAMDNEKRQVYIAWDDKFQKGIYMTKSVDGGTTWDPVNRISGSEDMLGRAAPYNVEVSSFQNKVLLTWQIGEPDVSRCSLYSQWSVNDGGEWDKPVKVIDDIFDCPKAVKIILTNDDFFVASLETETELSLVAWNGLRWSNQQVQSGVLNLVNPVTDDAIQFGCQKALLYQSKLYVIGCDNRRGGDVWYVSRQLDDVNAWFLPLTEWRGPDILVNTPHSISSLSFVADGEKNIHAFWVQSPSSVYDESDTSIYYARWNGKQWLFNVPIIGGLSGLPTQISVVLDTNGRVFLTWVDANNGNLLFSWAYVNRANIPSEWVAPQQLPSVSQWTSAPDMLVDATGKLVVAYAVPLNDERGIYIVESTDSGQNWSLPVKVFDAVSEDWSMVDNPKIALDNNGVLHVLFGRYDISKIDQSKGLYYSQSSNGGSTWSKAQLIVERSILWSELASYDDHTVRLFWQEQNKSVFANMNQVSNDGGVTWEAPFDVTNVNDQESQTTLAMDRMGHLHVFQLVDVDAPLLLDWKWDGTDWVRQNPIQLNDKYHGGRFSIVAGATSENYMNVSLSVEYRDSNNHLNSEILTFSRYVGDVQTGNETSLPSIVNTPVPSPTVTPVISQAELTLTPLPSFDDQALSSTSVIKNIIGFILLGVVVFAFFLVIRRRRK